MFLGTSEAQVLYHCLSFQVYPEALVRYNSLLVQRNQASLFLYLSSIFFNIFLNEQPATLTNTISTTAEQVDDLLLT